MVWYGEVRNVRFKKTIRGLIHYLDKPEVEALLAVPDCTTSVGHRNYVLLLFLYNSGARASEAANLCIDDLDLDTGPHPRASVRILGKGGKYGDARSGKKPRCTSPSSCKGALRQNECS